MTTDPTYIPDPAKVATHARLDQSPHHAYVRAGESAIHLGLRRDQTGARSGLILRVAYVAACSGKQIGGPWGCTKSQTRPVGSDICPRCAKYAAKHGIDLTAALT